MGVFESLQELFIALIATVLLGAFIVGVYPTALSSYGNNQVFLLGSIVMLIIGVIPIFFLFSAAQKAYRQIFKGDSNDGQQGGFGGYQP